MMMMMLMMAMMMIMSGCGDYMVIRIIMEMAMVMMCIPNITPLVKTTLPLERCRKMQNSHSHAGPEA